MIQKSDAAQSNPQSNVYYSGGYARALAFSEWYAEEAYGGYAEHTVSLEVMPRQHYIPVGESRVDMADIPRIFSANPLELFCSMYPGSILEVPVFTVFEENHLIK